MTLDHVTKISSIIVFVLLAIWGVYSALLSKKINKLNAKAADKDSLIKELEEWIATHTERMTTFCKHFEIPVPKDFNLIWLYSKFFEFKTLAGKNERLEKENKTLKEESEKLSSQCAGKDVQIKSLMDSTESQFKTCKAWNNKCNELLSRIQALEKNLEHTVYDEVHLKEVNRLLRNDCKRLLSACRSKIYRMKKKLTAKG